MINIHTPGGHQEVSIISESGLYKLTFRSNKPEAKRLTKWVTSEVLPTIRKTGSYSLPTATNILEREKSIFGNGLIEYGRTTGFGK